MSLSRYSMEICNGIVQILLNYKTNPVTQQNRPGFDYYIRTDPGLTGSSSSMGSDRFPNTKAETRPEFDPTLNI